MTCCDNFQYGIDNELIQFYGGKWHLEWETQEYTGCGEYETDYHEKEFSYCPFCGVKLME